MIALDGMLLRNLNRSDWVGNRRSFCSWERNGTKPVPVASPKNVTENSALWIARHQRRFRQSCWVRQPSCRRGVDQLVCDNASPLLHPAL